MARKLDEVTPPSLRGVQDEETIAEPSDGNHFSIDVVFVHGLTSSWQATWNSNGTSWIRDFLPDDIPHARILFYGYDARILVEENMDISKVSYDLLQGFEKARENERRPVIFVAHSLGGLILQAFLQKCSLSLQKAIHAIMFLGTPNFGSHKANWTEFAASMSNLEPTTQNRNRSPITGRAYMSQLGIISDGFRESLCLKSPPPYSRKIICFFELLPTHNDVMIVQKEAAILPQCDSSGLSANHIDMTRFSTVSSPNYQAVIHCMKSIYCLADDSMEVLFRHSLRPELHGRTRNLPTTPDGCEEFMIPTKGSPEARESGRIALILEDQGHYEKAEGKLRSAVELLVDSNRCSPEAKELSHHVLASEDLRRDRDKMHGPSTFWKNQQSPGPDDVAILFCLTKLAFLLCKRGRYADVESCCRTCLSARIQVSGKGSKSTLLTANVLALSMRYQGRCQEAYDLLWDALENADMTTPDTVPHVSLLDTLARLALDCGLDDVAEALSYDVVRRSISLYGDKHPFTLNRMSNLAAILGWTGRIPEAEAISRYALDGLGRALGAYHPCCLKTSRRLADYIRFQQRYYEVIPRLKQILNIQGLRLGEHHPETLSTMRSLGAIYAHCGYLTNAEAILNYALGGQKKCFGSEHQYTIWTSKALVGVKKLLKTKNPKDAEVQRELIRLFGPIQRLNTKTRYQRNDFMSSPFQTSIDGRLIRSARNANTRDLQDILNDERIDPSILGRALREAAAVSNKASVQLLLDRNAPINAQSAFHGSPLQAASHAGNSAVVKLLLDKRPTLDEKGGVFDNSLRAAVLGRHTLIIGLLLRPGHAEQLSKEILNSSMQPALHIEDIDTIEQLLEAGADINAKDNLFGSPLQQASFLGQQKILELLIHREADIQMRGGIFGRPLQAAIETQREAVLAQLLEAGALIVVPGPEASTDASSSHETSKNAIPVQRKSGSKKALAQLILDSHADSLQRTSMSDAWDFTQPLRRAESPIESTVYEAEANHSSQDIVPGVASPERDSRFNPSFNLKRLFTSKSRTGNDNSTGRLSLKRFTRMIQNPKSTTSP